MLRHLTLALFVTLGLGACASTGAGVGTETTEWSLSSLAGTTWSEFCPGGNPERTFVELRDDGTFAYRYPDEDWSHDGNERWEVSGGELVISWNDGYAVTRYRLDAGAPGLPGQSTKPCKPFTLEFVGPR